MRTPIRAPHQVSDLDSQRVAPRMGSLNTHADVTVLNEILRSAPAHYRKHIEQLLNRLLTVPGGVNMTPLSGKIVKSKTLQIAVPQNYNRTRFVLYNATTAGESLFWSYGNVPNSLLELGVGETHWEEGSQVCTSDIWVSAATVGHAFVAYEGIPDDRARYLSALGGAAKVR